MMCRLDSGWQPGTEYRRLRSLSGSYYTAGFVAPLLLSAVWPVRVLCAVQIELKHFEAPDTVVPPKMPGQFIDRDGSAADGKTFSRFIPSKRDWAFECLVHKPTSELIGYYIY
jgi:hypothetical protein